VKSSFFRPSVSYFVKERVIHKNAMKNAIDFGKCYHLFLRGNYQMDMFYDKLDRVNAWNRLWLSAKATGVIIISVIILDNHLHINAIFENDEQRTSFKRHFRMSISQYYNHRYHVSGSLGSRVFKHASLKDLDDLRDCICYHIRNVLHHGISRNYMEYLFSTARFVFGLNDEAHIGVYVRDNLPENLSRAYLPVRAELIKGWQMTSDGMIVPPVEVFRADLVEAIFDNSREFYLKVLSQKTMRESSVSTSTVALRDAQIIEFVMDEYKIPIPSMNRDQKIDAICYVVEAFPKVKMNMLSRIFGIPYSSLRRRMHSRTAGCS